MLHEEPERSLRDFERVLDDHLNDALFERLDQLRKELRLIALMVFVFGMCWVISKVFPLLHTGLVG